MKKLMIALGVVAVAAAVQASNFVWNLDPQTWQCLPGSSTSYFDGTAYFFDSADVTQQQVINAGKGLTGLGYLATITLSEGESTGESDTFTWGEGGQTLTGFYATVLTEGEKDYVFISPTGSGNAQKGSGSTTIYISNVEGPSAEAAKTSTTFAGSAWYDVSEKPGPEPIPEPTSAMLMLLGVAGLALKRKRA